MGTRESGVSAAAVLSMLVLGVGASAAQGAALTIAPTSGPPGTKLTATASGFTAEEPLTFKAAGRYVGDDAASGTGGGSVTFRISKDVDVDVVNVVVRGEGSHKAARAQFTVRIAWNQLGRGPAHNNANLFERNLGPDVVGDLERVWQSASGVAFDRSSPIKPSSLVYAARNNGAIGAFNATSGAAQAWTAPPGGLASLSTPAYSGSRLFVGDQTNKVRALSTTTFATVWNGNTNGAVSGPITVDGSTVYAGSEDGKVYAFPVTCASVCPPTWVGNVGSPVRGGVAVAYGRVYALGLDSSLRAFNVGCATGGATCNPVDTSPSAGAFFPEGTPAVSGGNVYAVMNNKAIAYDAHCLNCNYNWIGQLGGGAIRGGIVAAGGMVYASTGDRVRAFPAACGEGSFICPHTWEGTHATNPAGGIAYADGMVWNVTGRRLLGYDAKCGTGGVDCTPLVSVPTPAASETTPLVADGRVYITTGGTISAYGVPDA